MRASQVGEIPEGLTPAPDTTPAQWVIDGLSAREHTVRSLVPDGLEAYCRVFHPASTYELDERGYPVNERTVTWAEIAERNGRTMHPEAQFEAITGLDRYKDQSAIDGGQLPTWRGAATDGSLDIEIIQMLVPILEKHTTTPDSCYFAHWGGYGGLPESLVRSVPSFGYPWPNAGRDHMLFTGAIRSAVVTPNEHHHYSVNVWWPEDHAWLVATDIDLDSTYIGGSQVCIEAICGHADIEALEADPTHVVTRDGDKINPPLESPDFAKPKREWFWQR
jgi:hypothetical protein